MRVKKEKNKQMDRVAGTDNEHTQPNLARDLMSRKVAFKLCISKGHIFIAAL